MNIVMIGVGYVGLVTGVCFAEMGHRVTCLDIDETKIKRLSEGIIPIYEPGLTEMVERNIETGRLKFTTDYDDAVNQASIFFIAVDTPMSKDGSADIKRVEEVARSIAVRLVQPSIIVIKSTVPVGTSLKVEEIIQKTLEEKGITLEFHVISNPEFLKEGDAVQDFMKPDRVILGINDPSPLKTMKSLYAPFMLNHDRLIVMNRPSAELSKYAANAALATRVSFMNEMANLCEKTGADIDSLRRALGSDQRIGNQFLYAGVGFGGSCFPKDIQALLYQSHLYDTNLLVVEAVSQANVRQKQLMGKKMRSYFSTKGGLQGKTIGILGLSFKPNTDDMREAPSLALIEELLKEKVQLRLFDPVAMNNAKLHLGQFPQITWCQDEITAAQGADALVLMTEWKQFRTINFSSLLHHMRGDAFFDGRNQFSPLEMSKKGFDYISIGRQPSLKNRSLDANFID